MTMDGIYLYLVKSEQNESNLRILLSKFDRTKFLPFVGAGPSIPLGACDWDGLFSGLKEIYKVAMKLRKKNGRVNYPLVFERLYKKISPEQKKKFFSSIFEQVDSKIASWNAIHAAMVGAFPCYVTTNFDVAIEKAYHNQKKKQLKKYYFHCPKPELELLEDSVVYLHGHRDINFAILKKSDYKYFYPTVSGNSGIPIIESFLEYLYRNKRIIFIGFSFTDEFITDFIKTLSSRIKNTNHFLLIDENAKIYQENLRLVEKYKNANNPKEAEQQKNRFYSDYKENFNLSVIIYKSGHHKFLEDLFNELEQVGKKTTLQEKPISGEPEQ